MCGQGRGVCVGSVSVYAEMFQTNASSCLFSVLFRLDPVCLGGVCVCGCMWGCRALCIWAVEECVCLFVQICMGVYIYVCVYYYYYYY